MVDKKDSLVTPHMCKYRLKTCQDRMSHVSYMGERYIYVTTHHTKVQNIVHHYYC